MEEQEAYSAKQSARTQTLKLLQNKIAGTAKVQSDKVAKQAMLAENERLNAQMRLTMKADGAGGGGEAAPVATAAKKAVVTSAAFAPAAVAKPINIPKFVLEKADSMVKHKVTRELAKKFESQIDSDTNFIFSGSREDETNDENSQNLYNLDNAEESAPKKQLAQGEAAVTAPEHGFTNLHQMEKQVLSQLIEANQQRAQEAAQVAAQKAAAAKAAAKQKLALKKLRYQQEVKKEAQEAAQKAADKKAEKEKAAAATAAAAAKYAKAHKPVTKMTVRERALAFVRAFDDSVAEKEGTTLKSSHDGTNLGATLGGDSSSSLSDHSSTSIVLSAPMVSLSAPGTTGL